MDSQCFFSWPFEINKTSNLNLTGTALPAHILNSRYIGFSADKYKYFLFAGIGRTLIPRYFRSIFEGGVTDMRYELRHPKESFHNTSITMDCDQCVVATLHGKPMFTKVPIKEVYLKKVVFLTYSSSIFYLMSAAPRRIYSRISKSISKGTLLGLSK